MHFKSEIVKHCAHALRLYAVVVLILSASDLSFAIDYPYSPYNEGKMEPQKTGWPLSDEERTYVVDKAEHERRPGARIEQASSTILAGGPSAGHWGGTSWLDTHAKLVDYIQANKGPIDILLVGDSITQQWGSTRQRSAQRFMEEAFCRLQNDQYRNRWR